MAKTVRMCLMSMRKYRIARLHVTHLVRYYKRRGSMGKSIIFISSGLIEKGSLNSSEYSIFYNSRMCSERW